VIQRNEIKDPSLLDNVIKFIFDNCGNITSVKRISDFFKTQKLTASVDKILNYIHYLEKAFLVYKAHRYDIKGLRLLELYSKYYAGDIGLRHGLLGYKDRDINGLLENIVYLELLQRGYSVFIGKLDTMEVDFIAEKQNKKIYIQVCYLLPNEEVINREFRPLERIRDSYPKYVLTLDEFQSIEQKGIKTIYLLDFLLAK
jgi:predicted AAA+ superfamily ATPase